ncbi:hypothetical protein [Acinetobacter shaoyimingii]|uniref:Uncharacterized protein n=1 Tax=Acinetobacter shaoyimingii TaxID=2715164 RepID=A0A6G8RS22_9GAMM|nr:hypothetical protein [Acinetobacter shaoyimingii]NHB56811.1 hypothetical protein [Acinetobacter shaoyimingii]QIO04685.1 hypothetical protein G8E00_01285 [Acinetobacter shaoyimingii]
MFKPFQVGTESHAIHDLTIENGLDRINIYGNLQIGKDQQGLNAAKTLQALLNQVVSALEHEQNLPEKVQVQNEKEIENPFL